MSKSSNNDKGNAFILGDYLIKQTIGKGTFGKVKLGIYLPNKEKVAIKILEKSKMKEKDDQERAVREMEIIQDLKHQNIVQIYEILETIDKFYIVMEYCEHGELFNYIVDKRRLSNEEAAFFYYQIINGLDYIHSKGVVHRDLKPENLLLDRDNILKIIDFGLSNYFDKELLSTPCGSPCYASPEMVSGNKYNGFNIDVWSSGIILFAMICGYLPFEDKDHSVLFQTILECEVEYPRVIGPSAKDLLKKILVNEPDKRIKIKDIKKHKFYLKGEKIYQSKFGTTNSSYVEVPVEETMNNKNNNSSKKNMDINSVEYFDNEESNNIEKTQEGDKLISLVNESELDKALEESVYVNHEKMLDLINSEIKSNEIHNSPFNFKHSVNNMKLNKHKRAGSKNKNGIQNFNSINNTNSNIKREVLDDEFNFIYEPIQTEGNVQQRKHTTDLLLHNNDEINNNNISHHNNNSKGSKTKVVMEKKHSKKNSNKRGSLSSPKPAFFKTKNSSHALLKRTANDKIFNKPNPNLNIHPTQKNQNKNPRIKHLNLSSLLTLNSMRVDKKKNSVKSNERYHQTEINKPTKLPSSAYKANNSLVSNKKKDSLDRILFNNAIINFNMYEQKIYIPTHTEGNVSSSKLRQKTQSQNKDKKPTPINKIQKHNYTNSIKIPLKKNILLFNNLPLSGGKKVHTHSISKSIHSNNIISNTNKNRSPDTSCKKNNDRISTSQLKYSYNVCHTEDNQASRANRDLSNNNTEKQTGNSSNSHINLGSDNVKVCKMKHRANKNEENEGITCYADYNHNYLKTETNIIHNCNNSISNASNFFNKKNTVTNKNTTKKAINFQMPSKHSILNGHSKSIWANPFNQEAKKPISSNNNKSIGTEGNIVTSHKPNNNNNITKGKDLEKIILSIREQMRKKNKFIINKAPH